MSDEPLPNFTQHDFNDENALWEMVSYEDNGDNQTCVYTDRMSMSNGFLYRTIVTQGEKPNESVSVALEFVETK